MWRIFVKNIEVMDLQTRRIHFIQEFLSCANSNMLDRFEEILEQEQEKALEKELKPITIKEYEQRIEIAIEDVRNGRAKSVRDLKEEVATWK